MYPPSLTSSACIPLPDRSEIQYSSRTPRTLLLKQTLGQYEQVALQQRRRACCEVETYTDRNGNEERFDCSHIAIFHIYWTSC